MSPPAGPRITGFLQRMDAATFGVIYGAIMMLSVLLSLGAHPFNPLGIAVILFGSVLAIAMARAFAGVMAHSIETGERITRHAFRDA
jgi:hypothetical protein